MRIKHIRLHIGSVKIQGVEVSSVLMTPVVHIRIVWLPYWVENHQLAEYLSSFGKVLEITHEQCIVDKLTHTKTGVIRAKLLSLCFICNMRGHYKNECTATECGTCSEIGHTKNDCMITKSMINEARKEQEHISSLIRVRTGKVDTPMQQAPLKSATVQRAPAQQHML